MLLEKYFFNDEVSSRSMLKSALISLVTVLSILIILSYKFFMPIPTHELLVVPLNLSSALNHQLCGVSHSIDPNLEKYFKTVKISKQTRLYDLPHCGTQMYQWEGEGLPLYWVNTAIMRIFGNITVFNFLALYRILQIIPFLLISFYLSAINMRFSIIWVLNFIAIAINNNSHISVLEPYGFVLPILLSVISLYGLSIYLKWYKNILKHSVMLDIYL